MSAEFYRQAGWIPYLVLAAPLLVLGRTRKSLRLWFGLVLLLMLGWPVVASQATDNAMAPAAHGGMFIGGAAIAVAIVAIRMFFI